MKTVSIGRVAERTGLATSAIRFYEEKGLVRSIRDQSGRRRFATSDIRRLSFVIIAQKLGFTLSEIRSQLDTLPKKRTPNVKDWERMSLNFRKDIDSRIFALEAIRERLSDCIGCGCLSLKKCSLNNPSDDANRFGVGPRYLLGNRPMSR